MLTVPLAAVSAVSAINSAISAEDRTKRAETDDDFATLLGMQVAVAAGEARPGPAIVRPALPKGGKALPVVADAEPKAGEPASPAHPATDKTTALAHIDLAALPLEAIALAAPHPTLPTPLATGGSKPVEGAPQFIAVRPESPALVVPAQIPPAIAQAERATNIPSKPDDDTAAEPNSKHPNAAPQFSLPAQASARALLIHAGEPGLTVDPIKSGPVLPEQAAAQATIALAARGDHERPARMAQAGAAEALPTDAETQSALPPTSLRPLKAVLAERAAPADPLPALATITADGESQSALPTAASVSAPPSVPRHDFAAMIDRLIEARDMAGAQPVAMTLRHDDFGAVSLNFRKADDGLSVTMASSDPEFARAVNAAAASGAASQGDLTRHGGEPATSRQHTGGSTSEDSTDQSRAGSRPGSHDAERDGSRQRRDQPQPHRNEARQPNRSGIFA